MFCPRCRSEYRPGFTRCPPCDVDLVDDLDRAAAARPSETRAPSAGSAGEPLGPFVDYCGFLDLGEARSERDRLRAQRVLARISVRETPPGDLDGPVAEEYWLRVPREAFPRAAAILGYDAFDETADERFACAACGEDVPADAERCPRCGASFEDGP